MMRAPCLPTGDVEDTPPHCQPRNLLVNCVTLVTQDEADSNLATAEPEAGVHRPLSNALLWVD